MTEQERARAQKIVVGCYMVHYVTRITKKESVFVGNKSDLKQRLRKHCGLKNSVLVQQFDGKTWNVVLSNSHSKPVNTLFTEDELWQINRNNTDFDHLEDLFGGVLPLPCQDTDRFDSPEPALSEPKADSPEPALSEPKADSPENVSRDISTQLEIPPFRMMFGVNWNIKPAKTHVDYGSCFIVL